MFRFYREEENEDNLEGIIVIVTHVNDLLHAGSHDFE